MSNKRVLVWTLAGVLTPGLGNALAQAAGCSDVQFLKEGSAAAEPGGAGLQALQQQLLQRLKALAERPALVVHDATATDLSTSLLLAQAAADLGFQHLFVYFRRDARRMMPRMATHQALAALDVDALVQRSRRGVQMLAALMHHAGQQGWPTFALAVEDLESAADAAPPARQQQLLAWLQADAAEHELLRKLDLARRTLPDLGAQAGMPRAARLRQELAWEPGVEARYVWLRPQVQVGTPAAPEVAALRLTPLPPYVVSGQELGLTGALRLQAGTPPGWSLKLVVDGEDYVVAWNPADADVAPARFDTGVLPVRGGMAMRLVLVSPRGEDTTLAAVDWVGPAHEPVPGILLGELSLGYVALPKVACTSLKRALFKLAVEQAFDPKSYGDHVHRYFTDRPRDIRLAGFKFLVVRDPVKRFLSAYSNRVLHHRELSRPFVKRAASRCGFSLEGFVFDPDLDTFVERFETYCKVRSIADHTRPMSHLVPRLEAFDKIYPLESMQALQADISSLTGQAFEVGRSQTGGPKIGIDALSLSQLERLFEFYREDYALLKDFYTPEQVLAERAQLISK